MANESEFLTKLHAAWCLGWGVVCGVVGSALVVNLFATSLWRMRSGSGVESPAGVGESPVREMCVLGCAWCPRVAVGSWNLL